MSEPYGGPVPCKECERPSEDLEGGVCLDCRDAIEGPQVGPLELAALALVGSAKEHDEDHYRCKKSHVHGIHSALEARLEDRSDYCPQCFQWGAHVTGCPVLLTLAPADPMTVEFSFTPWNRDIQMALRVTEWARQQMINQLEGNRADLSDHDIQRQGEVITGVAALSETLMMDGWEHHQKMKAMAEQSSQEEESP